AFAGHLAAKGWSVSREVDFCDLVAEREGSRLFVEAKGRTTAPGLDVDTMYGQILRRMPVENTADARFAVVVPDEALTAALRVPDRVRSLLGIDVYAVDEVGAVRGPMS